MTHKTMYFIMLLSALWLLPACKDDDSMLNVATDEIQFDPTGGSQTITIDCNDDWSINGLAEWLMASQNSGINKQEVTLTASANTTGVDREQTLMIRTNDSRNVHTISVRQYAYADGPRFSIDDSSVRYFSGYTAGFENTIEISSSAKWTITGPDWMYMRYQGVETPISGDLKEGSGAISLRVYADNAEEEKRQDTICIQKFGSKEKIIIPVVQLGKYDVKCVNMHLLSDGLWTKFVYGGSGMKSVRFGAIEGIATEEQIAEDAGNLWNISGTASISDLKPDTDYTIYMRINLLASNKVSIETIHTPSNVNQPRALIQDVELGDDGRWHYSYIMNQQAMGFYRAFYTGNQSKKMNYAYNLYNSIVAGTASYETENAYRNCSNADYTLLTWAVGKDGQLSNFVDMYKIYASTSALAPVWQQTPQIEHVGAIEVEKLKNE